MQKYITLEIGFWIQILMLADLGTVGYSVTLTFNNDIFLRWLVAALTVIALRLFLLFVRAVVTEGISSKWIWLRNSKFWLFIEKISVVKFVLLFIVFSVVLIMGLDFWATEISMTHILGNQDNPFAQALEEYVLPFIFMAATTMYVFLPVETETKKAEDTSNTVGTTIPSLK